MYTTTPSKRCQGFLLPMAILILVILTALAAFMSSTYTSTQMSVASDVSSSQAYQALLAGKEWALYQIMQNSTPANPLGSCQATPGSEISLSANSLNRFNVTVACDWLGPSSSATPPNAANEIGLGVGEGFYRINIWACSDPLTSTPKCPGNAQNANYIEQAMSLTGEK